jgi:hypothetical protein
VKNRAAREVARLGCLYKSELQVQCGLPPPELCGAGAGADDECPELLLGLEDLDPLQVLPPPLELPRSPPE